MRVTTVVSLLMIVAMLMGACSEGGEPAPGGPPAPSVPVSVAANGDRWLAAVEVAPLADDLSAATERLRDPLGLSLVVSPVDCFEGLPSELETGYLIGAVGDSAHEVERLVVDAGEKVLFTASVTIVCTD